MTKIQSIFFLLTILIFTNHLQAQKDENLKTLSPYFQVKSTNSNVDALPLKNTDVDVNITGMIADVTVRQVYANEGKVPLEAIYTFPASTNAAVYAMEMQIGERVIKAKIKEKEAARKDYEQAKKEGKRASLLEQQRPNVFQMNISNIMPNDEVMVTLKYTEYLVPTKGIYEFVYPTVVGPRYSNDRMTEEDKNTFSNTPYQKEGELACYDFDINTRLRTGVPVQDISSESHHLRLQYPAANEANVYLHADETNAGNRDYVLQYQLAGEQINSGITLYEHEDENFFLMMVQPPKRIENSDIPPREYIFINDVSGSMSGYPMDVSKKIMRNLLSNLRPEDRFNVLVFAGTSGWLWDKSREANYQNLHKAIDFIDNHDGNGGTEIINALKKALNFPREDEAMSRSFVIVTDGYVMVEKETFDLIRNSNDQANTFVFGIGSSVNRYLIEGMARVGMGEPFIVLNDEETNEKAESFREYISSPVLTQVKLNFSNFDVYDVEPLTVPDVFAERPIIVYGKYKGKPNGSVQIKGYNGRKKWKEQIDISKAKADEKNAALRYLWARKKIQQLDDYGALDYQTVNKEKVTELGLKYNLLTNYTSFIAVEETPVNNNNNLKTVKQAIPLPQNVSNYAIGFDMELDEEIEIELLSKYDQINCSGISNISSKTLIIDHIDEKINSEINNCLDNPIDLENIEIHFSSTGKVEAINFKNKDLNKEIVNCIENLIQSWNIDNISVSNSFTVNIQF